MICVSWENGLLGGSRKDTETKQEVLRKCLYGGIMERRVFESLDLPDSIIPLLQVEKLLLSKLGLFSHEHKTHCV